MNLSHRPMLPEDIPECVQLLTTDRVIGPRYREVARDLPEALLRLLQSEACTRPLIHADVGSGRLLCAMGVGVMVSDDFLGELKTPPHFWAGPEMVRRIARGETPFLTAKEIRERNSRSGLNLVCWDHLIRAGYVDRGELSRFCMAVFIEIHRGYRWQELISSPASTPEHLDFVLGTGGYIWDPADGEYTSAFRKSASEMVASPHVLGTTPEMEARRGVWSPSWVGTLFDYHPPKLRLSRSEQRILSFALPGATDEVLAEQMDISLSAVKKVWISVYRRAEEFLPELVSNGQQLAIPASARGREKRRSLLSYIREHPEELRPLSLGKPKA